MVMLDEGDLGIYFGNKKRCRERGAAKGVVDLTLGVTMTPQIWLQIPHRVIRSDPE